MGSGWGDKSPRVLAKRSVEGKGGRYYLKRTTDLFCSNQSARCLVAANGRKKMRRRIGMRTPRTTKSSCRTTKEKTDRGVGASAL